MKKWLVLFPLLIGSPLFSGVTGKIAGRVTDKTTGNSLPGVNVIIAGTAMGAAADMDGYYYIINVPAGTYSIRVSMMGYKPLLKQEIRVSADLTTTVNFELEPTVIKGKEIIVTARRPMVIPDATATMHVSTGKEIEERPVDTYGDALASTAGVVNSAGGASGVTDGFHIRGGRGDEVAYMVDGMSVQDRLTGRAGAAIDINTNAIQEMEVITGGFNAEYGKVMSGVVNLMTKEGTRKPSGIFRYRSDIPFTSYLDHGRNQTEANIGGPAPLVRNLFYFFSGEVMHRDRLYAFKNPEDRPDSKECFHRVNTDRDFYSTQGKITYKFKPEMKLNMSGFLSRTQWGSPGVWVGTPILNKPGAGETDWRYVPPDHRFSNLRKAYQIKSSFTHSITPSTFYELKFGYFATHTTTAERDFGWEKERHWWEDYKFRPWCTYVYKDPPDWNGIDWYAKDENGNYWYPYGVPGLFAHGEAGAWLERESHYYGLNWDIVSQLTKHNQLKAGAEWKWYMVRRLLMEYIHHMVNVPILDNGEVVGYEIPPDYRLVERALYWDKYKEYPNEGAVYLQDKIEYPGFIVNGGLRIDYFNPESWNYNNPLSPYKPETTYVAGDTIIELVKDTVITSPKYQFSPRFGVSFPVTERTVLHFSYGHFFQMPILRYMYDSHNLNLIEAAGGWSLMGSTDTRAQKTIHYEFGIAHQISSDIALHITSYYKDIYNLLGTRRISAPGMGYTSYVAEDYGNVKGVEFVLRKAARRWLSGQIAYALQSAKGTSSYEREAYYDYIANVEPDPITGEWKTLPKTAYSLEFDQTHSISTEIDFFVPRGMGPVVGTIRPLEALRLAVTTDIGSGLPYSKRDDKNLLVGVTNAERMPWTINTDLKLTKDFTIFGQPLSAFLQVANLFNRKNIQNVYPNNGDPRDPGLMREYDKYISSTFPKEYADEKGVPVWTPGCGYSQAADSRRDLDGDGYITKDEWYQSYVNAYQDYVNDPGYYSAPRHINLGISLNW